MDKKNKSMLIIGGAVLVAMLLAVAVVIVNRASGTAGVQQAPAPCPACRDCPTCPACPTCAAPLGYDAVGSISYWIVDNNKRNGQGVYVTATFRHVGDKWVPDLINSTGGVKPESGLRELVDPDIALNKCLNVARTNQGAGTTYISEIPYDYGRGSASFNIWAPSEDGYKTIYSAAVILVP